VRRALPLLLALAVALAATPGAQAATCSDDQPCLLQALISDASVQVVPANLTSLGPYILAAANVGANDTTLGIAGTPVLLEVPANATRQSAPFVFPEAGAYTVDAGGNRTATLQAAAEEEPAASDAGRASRVLAIVLPVLVGLALIGVAALVFRHGREHRHNLFFAGLYLLSGLKSVGEGLSLLPESVHESARLFPAGPTWELLAFFCGLGLFPLLVLFVSSFPHPAKWLQRRPALGALPFLPSVAFAAVTVMVLQGELDVSWFDACLRAFNYLLVAATVGAIVWLLRTRSRTKDPIERTQALYVLVGFLPSFVLGWAITALQEAQGAGVVGPGAGDDLVEGILHFVSPLLELVACGLVGFAILKYNILGIDPKFRVGVKSVIVGFLFAVVFLTTQGIENLIIEDLIFSFAGQYGSFLLSGVSGLVLFKPIERASDKVANKLLPPQNVDGGSKHAEEIYHAQASYVLRDSKVTDRELTFLRNLREQLGLTEATARRIEEQVERLLEVDDARLGQQATGAGAVPSASAVAAARHEAGAVAGSDIQVTRAAKSPPRRPAAAPAKAAAAKAAARASGKAPAAKGARATKPAAGAATKPKGGAGKASPGARKPAAASRKATGTGGRKGST
jgi:hypothetical protein